MHEIWDSLICPLLANADMPARFSSVANDPKRPFKRLGGVGRITRPEIAAMPQLSISWQRLNSASELRNLTATMARMNCATIVGELWSNHA
jgi:hypothetical protein